MGMNITQMPCNPDNYTAKRSSAIRYLVVHYTGAPGTARNNGAYFASRGDIGASAHYFVDAQDIVQSVPDSGRAWHCGAEARHPYWHSECRNANSIGIEMCSRKRADGSYYIKPETVANAAALAKDIMQRYGIDTDHVLRHYDVTGKRCPMPWVDDPAQWDAFKASLAPEENTDEEDDDMATRYNSVSELPEWAQEETQRLIDRGALQGDEHGNLDVTMDMLRTMIVCQRMVDGK